MATVTITSAVASAAPSLTVTTIRTSPCSSGARQRTVLPSLGSSNLVEGGLWTAHVVQALLADARSAPPRCYGATPGPPWASLRDPSAAGARPIHLAAELSLG